MLKQRLTFFKTIGATPGSLEAFLCLRGLRTLPLRYERSSKNAELLVERLRNHQAISKVVYPNSGNMISFIVNGGAKAADACVAQAKLIVKATSLGSVETRLRFFFVFFLCLLFKNSLQLGFILFVLTKNVS